MPLKSMRFRPEDLVRKSQKGQANPMSEDPTFHSGDHVWARDYRNQGKCFGGTILQKTGPLSHLVQVGSKVLGRDIDQLITRVEDCRSEPESLIGFLVAHLHCRNRVLSVTSQFQRQQRTLVRKSRMNLMWRIRHPCLNQEFFRCQNKNPRMPRFCLLWQPPRKWHRLWYFIDQLENSYIQNV